MFQVQNYQDFFDNFINCISDDEYKEFPKDGLFDTYESALAYVTYWRLDGIQYRAMTWRIVEIKLIIIPTTDN